MWLAVFGFINAVAAFRGGWKATALPSPKLCMTDDVAGNDLAITSEKEETQS